MLDRKIFAQWGEDNWETVIYKQVDCQQFVENGAKAAGYKFNSRGSNDMYRNYTIRKGKTASFNPALGDIVFKWRDESSKLPERYRGDGIGDMYHVGIVTQAADGKYVVCHSSNSKDNGKRDVFSSLDALARTWQYAGTLKNTGALAPEPEDSAGCLESVSADEIIKAQEHLEEALDLIKVWLAQAELD